MYAQTLDFIANKRLFTKKDKLLVAVSGGADSMVLLHILHKAGYPLEVAHCNFQLRGSASAQDAQFVIDYCTQHDIQAHTRNFDTARLAKEYKASVEMLARELRYTWFKELATERNCSKIAVGHHQQDVVETFFINLSRGTGLKGLTGIKALNGEIVRPLLFATRSQIDTYAEQHGLNPRLDASNLENKYVRNQFRNQILPNYRTYFPQLDNSVERTIQHLDESYQIFQQHIKQVQQQLVRVIPNGVAYPIKELLALHPKRTYLYEFVQEFGFSFAQVEELLRLLQGPTGKRVSTHTHTALKDREDLLIYKSVEKIVPFVLPIDFSNPYGVYFTLIQETSDYQYPTVKNKIALDFQSLEFPLSIRSWEQGDSFYPIGMKNRVKLKDFYVNIKLSRKEKAETLLLIDAQERIVWVVGHRMDDRFKVRKDSSQILEVVAKCY